MYSNSITCSFSLSLVGNYTVIIMYEVFYFSLVYLKIIVFNNIFNTNS